MLPEDSELPLHAEDAALVQRLLGKDREAFEAFFAAYFPRLHRFALSRVSDSALCEDLVQETMTKALRALAQYRGEASLHTWLCQICRNEISSWMRQHGVKDARLISVDEDPGIKAVLESASAVQADYGEALATERLVHLTLDYLPEKYGQALEWKYIEGLSVHEIAERFGVTAIIVQSLLARARTAFRDCYVNLQQELKVST